MFDLCEGWYILMVVNSHPWKSQYSHKKGKGKGFLYSIPSLGPGADPGVHNTGSEPAGDHKSSTRRLGCLYFPPGLRLPSQPQSITVLWPVPSYTLYSLVTEAHRCEQLAQGCYAALPQVGFEPATYWSQVQHPTRCVTVPRYLRKHRPKEEWWVQNCASIPVS